MERHKITHLHTKPERTGIAHQIITLSCLYTESYNKNRKEMGGELTHVAIAVEGVGIANSKEAMALAILSRGSYR